MNWSASQLKALGNNSLPEYATVNGRRMRLARVFKHTFAAAVGVYEKDGWRVVVKYHRRCSLLGFPMEWIGRLMARYEETLLKRCQDLQGVPRAYEVNDPVAIAHDFIDGEPLHRDMEVGDRFFPEFLQLIRDIHSRGIAYVDLEKPENILVGSDGRPYLIDFQTAFYVPPKLLGETTLICFLRKLLQRADMYHVMKHYRRVRPDQLTAEQIAYGRKRPLPVRMGNVLIAPWKKIARKFGR
jgi:RIO-like serine/threonine protein kinase